MAALSHIRFCAYTGCIQYAAQSLFTEELKTPGEFMMDSPPVVYNMTKTKEALWGTFRASHLSCRLKSQSDCGNRERPPLQTS